MNPLGYFVLSILFLCLGMFLLGARFGLWLQRKSTVEVRLDRKHNRLISAQQNIVGRIVNALQESFSENLQWGHRLRVERIPCGDDWAIQVWDCQKSLEAPAIMFITVTTNNRGVEIGTWGDWVSTLDPNDTELTLFIGRQMDILKKWKPK